MAASTAMGIIDTEGIDIMAADTTIEDIMVDIMAVAEDITAADTEEDMQEAPIEAADTIVEDTVGPVAVDMPEAEAIEAAVTAEVLEATEAVVVAAAIEELAEVMAVVAAVEAVDTLLSDPLKSYTIG